MAEKASDSHVAIEEFAVCENCGKDFTEIGRAHV